MANRLLVLEAVNLFCGDSNPTASNHLVLLELKLPDFDENYAEHAAGGAPIAITIDTHINPLEASFILAGWQPQVMQLITQGRGLPWPQGQTTFTAYGLLRDTMTGEAAEAVAILRGMLGRVSPVAFHRGALHGHEFAIRGITYYDLSIEGEQIYFWDFFAPRRPLVEPDADTSQFFEAILPGGLV